MTADTDNPIDEGNSTCTPCRFRQSQLYDRSLALSNKRSITMVRSGSFVCLALVAICSMEPHDAFTPSMSSPARTFSSQLFSTTEEETTATNKNVQQTLDTSRDKVMTFSYDMSLEPKYDKPTYPGTGNGLSGDSGEYDVIVIGSGMGGLACGALSAKYGDKVLVLESHIKCGGSAHTFSRMHKGEKYSFEVGPSIFEGLDRPSLNPLRMIFDILGEEMPVKTYTGLGYWTPTGYWRFPIGSKQKFEDLLMEQAEDGPKAVEVGLTVTETIPTSVLLLLCAHSFSLTLHSGMECTPSSPQDSWRIHYCSVAPELAARCRFPCHHCRKLAICGHSP